VVWGTFVFGLLGWAMSVRGLVRAFGALPKPARDQKQAALLWEVAEKLTGVTFIVPAGRRAA
jgi:hypothetical protein